MIRWGRPLLYGLFTILAAHVLAYHLIRFLPDAALIAAGIAGADDTVRQGFARSDSTAAYTEVVARLFSGDLGTTLDGVSVASELVSALAHSLPRLLVAAVLLVVAPLVIAFTWPEQNRQSRMAEAIAFAPVYLPCTVLLIVAAVVDPSPDGPVAWLLASVALAIPAGSILAAQSARVTSENLRSGFVHTQRACGWHETRIRALLVRNLAHRLAPTLEKAWAALFVSLVFVESLFGLPGLGATTARAIRRSDLYMILAIVIVVAGVVVLLRVAAHFTESPEVRRE